MNDKFLKPYDPKETESRIYQMWEQSGYFNPDNLPARHEKPFTLIMPPPNANGHLHAGHGLITTLQDITTRYKRMQGFKALWVPGADHAGFETQVVYEKKLEKEGRSRFKMDRDELYKEILDFTLTNKKEMETEVRALGASCDWSREKFTLDPSVIAEVHRTFKKMHDDGLVYRGNRLVNWCTKHQTSLSDVETESKEMTDTLYHMQYGPFVVATVRPETMFGDTAIAVNPKDARYTKYVGTTIEIPNFGGIGETFRLPVIADDFVDMEFGTGAVKITPAHDKNDFDVAQRHNLPIVEVIDQFGKLTAKAGKYAGLKVAEARKQVAADLTASGVITKTEPYKHIVPVCYKCETVIEPRLIPQWFVKMKPLADMAAAAVDAGKVRFIPDNYRKIFMHWMNNPMDWNISRQIVWGIPIPAKICEKCGEGYVDLDDKLAPGSACEKCGGTLRKDTDTFDTWFSSGQWPLLSLGYSEGTDFKTFYPTDAMMTGSDLIFKWIPRMVIFGLYLVKEVPFKDVYLSGLVNDAHGKKMSKSKGNVISPLDLTEKYGTDAMRLGLIVGNTPGSDIALSENKIKGYKNFANKLWNVARFILSSPLTKEGVAIPIRAFSDYSEKDNQLLAEQAALIAEITKEMDEYKFYLVSEKLYHYVWDTLADVILEDSKKIFDAGTPAEKASRKQFLMETLRTIITLLHPFMPFVTEEIWQLTENTGAIKTNLLMVEAWPKEN